MAPVPVSQFRNEIPGFFRECQLANGSVEGIVDALLNPGPRMPLGEVIEHYHPVVLYEIIPRVLLPGFRGKGVRVQPHHGFVLGQTGMVPNVNGSEFGLPVVNQPVVLAFGPPGQVGRVRSERPRALPEGEK